MSEINSHSPIPALQKGDLVGVVATARKFTLQELEPTLDLLASWGLRWKIGKTIETTDLEYPQLAGGDAFRASDFQNMLDDTEVKAVWCARGGYGTIRMFDAIDWTSYEKNPKWIIGFSDVTVLHCEIQNRGYESIHAPMPVQIPHSTPNALAFLENTLFCASQKFSIPSHPMNILGNAKGRIVGGNLSILASLLGSPTALKTENCILFIEDLDEYLYHIDRMMMNLKRNQCFTSLKGVIIGGMTQMKDHNTPWGKNVSEILHSYFSKLNIPVCFEFPSGHIDNNHALILGKIANFTVQSEHVTLEI
jgi:muramoyltetrapeptide carboxypeptidase